MKKAWSPAAQHLVMACGFAVACGQAQGQCATPQWTSEFTTAATGVGPGNVHCMQVFDPDGAGPLTAELYIGGSFQTVAGAPALRIARWNGTSWSSVGSGVSGVGGVVSTMGLHDPDGSGPLPAVLVVAGIFANAGGTGATRLATWNGSSWGTLGTPPQWFGYPSAIRTFDPDGSGPQPSRLCVLTPGFEVGEFDYRGLAMWDGATWSWPGPGPSAGEAMEVYDSDDTGPEPAYIYFGLHDNPGISRWDGTTFSNVGGGLLRSMPYVCTALRVIDEDGPGPERPMLWAGGSFTTAGGATAPTAARWDGLAWSPLGPGPGTDVGDFIVMDDALQPTQPYIYAAGAHRLSLWSGPGQAWHTINELESPNWPFPPFLKLAAYRGTGSVESVYMGGPFVIPGQTSFGLRRLTCEGQCYPNCDHSTISPYLTANDFQCFMNNYAAANAYANCDGSSGQPQLTANDFQCFINKYAAGCS